MQVQGKTDNEMHVDAFPAQCVLETCVIKNWPNDTNHVTAEEQQRNSFLQDYRAEDNYGLSRDQTETQKQHQVNKI